MTLESRPTQQGSRLTSLLGRWEVQLLFLLILAVLISSALSPHFLKTKNLFDMTFNFIEQGMVALPMAFIIISGNIDLSVASNMAMSAVVMAASYDAGLNIWLAVLLGLTVGALGGLFNGLLVAKVRLPSLVVTLGTFALYRGLAFSILGDLTVKGFPSEFTYFGQGYIPGTPVPFSLVLFIVLAVIFGLLLHRTSLGRYVYSIGQNEEACRYSGVRVDSIKIFLFTLTGLMAALAGIILTARFGSVRADLALGFELVIITAVVLGGVDIFGGSGTMIGVVEALFLLGIVRFGMSLINIRGQIQAIAVGCLLILSTLIQQTSRQLRARPTTARRGRLAVSRTLLYALGGVIAVVIVLVLVNFLWLQPQGLGIGGETQASHGTPGSSGSEAGGAATPEATLTVLVLKPTNTPKLPPPTPTPRPTSTPTLTPEPTATPVTQETPGTEPTEPSEPTDTPTPTSIPRPDVPAMEVPGGPFTLGSAAFEPNETPTQGMELPTFFIDQFETTNAEYAQFVEATGYVTGAEEAGTKRNWRTYYEEGKDNHPVVKVSYADAEAYCGWMGKRLPTEFEWEKAARGPDELVYPWGSSMDSTRVNGKASGLRGTTAVGSFSSGASPYGVEDMAGNVWEWTSSPFVAYPGSTYQDPFYSPDLRVTRGGGWFDEPRQLRGSNRSAAAVETANDDLGFRCVSDSR
jgi:rhamnose transport system permease protein